MPEGLSGAAGRAGAAFGRFVGEAELMAASPSSPPDSANARDREAVERITGRSPARDWPRGALAACSRVTVAVPGLAQRGVARQDLVAVAGAGGLCGDLVDDVVATGGGEHTERDRQGDLAQQEVVSGFLDRGGEVGQEAVPFTRRIDAHVEGEGLGAMSAAAPVGTAGAAKAAGAATGGSAVAAAAVDAANRIRRWTDQGLLADGDAHAVRTTCRAPFGRPKRQEGGPPEVGPLHWHASPGQPPSAPCTTSLASSWTSRRWSAPRNDSA